MVHITDTQAQKVVSYTSAHITEMVFAHDQHWEEQSSLSSPQLYRHSQKLRKWINNTVGHYTTGYKFCYVWFKKNYELSQHYSRSLRINNSHTFETLKFLIEQFPLLPSTVQKRLREDYCALRSQQCRAFVARGV